MTAVVRLSADEVRLIQAGLYPIMVAKRGQQADKHSLIWRRLDEMDLTMRPILESKAGLIRLAARDIVALQSAIRVGREMLHYHAKRRIMDRQAERAAALMAKLEKYRKRIHRRDGITTPAWQHSPYRGWIQFRTFIRATHSFGRRTTIPGITMPRYCVSRAPLKEMRQVVAEYGPDTFERAQATLGPLMLTCEGGSGDGVVLCGRPDDCSGEMSRQVGRHRGCSGTDRRPTRSVPYSPEYAEIK